jgi:hypothetical protein
MSEEDDDKSTLIIDFDELKSELTRKREAPVDITMTNLKFGGEELNESTDEASQDSEDEDGLDLLEDPDLSSSAINLSDLATPELHCYEHESTYFTDKQTELENSVKLVIFNSLKELNKVLSFQRPKL